MNFSFRCRTVRDNLDLYYNYLYSNDFFFLTERDRLFIIFNLLYWFPLKSLSLFVVSKKNALSFHFNFVNIYANCVKALCSYAFLPICETMTDRICLGFKIYRNSHDLLASLKTRFKRKFKGIWFFSCVFNFNKNIVPWVLKNFPLNRRLLFFLLNKVLINTSSFGDLNNFSSHNFFRSTLGFLLNGLV